ncbi:hypothetical protein A3742_30120 [Oleiphilus sp. HI0071]|nr:hypothetical protein A3742_30120 [Oleiphilus sp. HI0071]
MVANQVSDLVMKRDGFDSLFDCRSPLKLASTMFFKRVNGAAYSLLKAAALRLDLDHSAPVNKERLAEQVALLASFVREAVSLSGELVSAEHYRSVRLLRSRIKKLDLLMNESGLLNVLDDECLNEARLCMEALPDFLEPTQRLLKEAQEVLPSSRSAAISQLNITLKTLLATLTKPRPFSLFI